jgi:signal transduction histidine kinase
LYWSTLILLAVGSCTLTFWILASSTGFFNVGAQEMFAIRAIGLVTLGLGAAGIFLIVAAMRRMTLPIRDMTASAERIAQGDYSVRVKEQGPSELQSLARSFNHMAEQLKDKDTERRTLVSNIAHELRTPLYMLRENIEGLVDGNFARDDAHLSLILGETIRLSNLVDEIRMLALAESGGLILQREPTDLNALVSDTIELYHRNASAKNVGLHTVVPEEPLMANVDPARIQQALGNIIDDALRQGIKSDIRVEVSRVELAPETAVGQIEVAYRAAVIAPDRLRGYFDRFYEDYTARETTQNPASASALGPAISKLLVTAHGGEISVTSDARSGTQLRMTVPLAE